MTPENFLILKFLCRALAGLFGILVALFAFFDTAKDEKHDDTRAWFKAKWEAIKDSPYLTLPERAIDWALQGRTLLVKRLQRILDHGSDRLIKPILLGLAILSIAGSWRAQGIYLAVFAIILSVPFILLLVREDWILKQSNKRKLVLVIVPFIGMGVTTIVCWMLVILRLNIYYAAPAMLLLFPFYWFALVLATFAISLSLDKEDWFGGSVMLFLLGVVLGFTTTFLALLLGHIADPQAYVPQTFQMLASNIVFDGLTMVATFTILDKAMGRTGMLRIPVAIFLDLLAAAVLACASLYFGLVFTAHALSFKSLLHVLVARSLDGTHFELSPYFWAMHTTFLPTFLYLALVLLCWLAKLMLSAVKTFFGKGQEHKNPLKLTAALCAVVAALFVVLGYMADDAKQYAELKLKEKPPPAAARP